MLVKRFISGEAVTSHSGPNDLDGELPATDEVKREKRGYFFPSHFQSDSGLLSRSEHPNEYLKKWITHEHNRYRRMVSDESFFELVMEKMRNIKILK